MIIKELAVNDVGLRDLCSYAINPNKLWEKNGMQRYVRGVSVPYGSSDISETICMPIIGDNESFSISVSFPQKSHTTDLHHFGFHFVGLTPAEDFIPESLIEKALHQAECFGCSRCESFDFTEEDEEYIYEFNGNVDKELGEDYGLFSVNALFRIYNDSTIKVESEARMLCSQNEKDAATLHSLLEKGFTTIEILGAIKVQQAMDAI